ncbi:type II secretion system protein GspH [Agrobacterium vitis]|uniref:Type II secretion system protein H n=1 Tax=Agrobacterium vitis TaxID=373 RepID=A0ABD6G5Y5_AGRVI|nr:GspH/FimT family pseudopilin [Agrobacterium vitis]MUO81772.1 type II secretion system protein GspH [Agrobacterium vitis]MUO93449.1 type II secretion system protein GspH [Agrobacterium vitis]MUP04300.1 type II secretion system protein GspH [Agrobacterium vitis]MUZ84180.1 type II secretion system protein GspH [Agrobacterium vitis]MVA13090.1 type II secretion system protein GspH [Agrobacterium vitis]
MSFSVGSRLARSENDGFSLLEMLVVMVIVSLAVGLISFQKSRKTQSVADTARAIVSVLNDARMEAVMRKAEVNVEVDLQTRTVSKKGQASGRVQIPDNVALEVRTADEFKYGNSRRIILFLPDGTSSGGRIRLQTGSATVSIETLWLTGLSTYDETH